MNEKKSLQEIVEQVAENTGITKKLSDSFFKALVEIIEEALKKDGIAKIKYIGTFKVVAIEERKSVNVQDGTELIIPAHKKITFIPEKTLKDDVNKPYAHLETYVLKDDGPVDGPFMEDDADDEDTNDFADTPDMDANINKEGNAPSVFGIAEIPTIPAASNDASDNNEAANPEESIITPSLSLDTEDEETSEENSVADTTKSVDSVEILPSTTTEETKVVETTENVTDESVQEIQTESEHNTTDAISSTVATEANNTDTNNNTSDNKEKTSNNMENNNEETVMTTSTDKTTSESSTTENTKINEESQKTKKDTSGEPTKEKKDESKGNNKWWLWLLIAVALIIAILFGVKYFMDNQQSNPSPAVPEVSNTEGEDDVISTESDPFFPEEEEQPIDMFEHPEAYVPASETEDNATTASTESDPVISGRTHSFDNKLVEYMNKKHPELNFPSTVNVKNDYTVIEGSRLAQISRNIYDGVFNYWVYIYYYNTDVLSSPDAVKPGMVLKVPDLGDEFVNTKSEKCKALATEIQGALLK